MAPEPAAAHDWYTIVSPAIGAALVALLGAVVVYARTSGFRLADADDLSMFSRGSSLMEILLRIDANVAEIVKINLTRERLAQEVDLEERIATRLRQELARPGPK
jgi:hypothetical protein